MKGKLIRIVGHKFVAGIECYVDYKNPHFRPGGRTHPSHLCAPIVKYMKFWTVGRILRYCKSRGWKYDIFPKESLPEWVKEHARGNK